MKSFYIFLKIIILSILSLMAISCPQDLVKGTAWTGTLKNSSGQERSIDAYFQPDSTVKMYFQNPNYPVISYSATGDYVLSNAYSLDTTLYGNGYFEGSGDLTVENFTLAIDGELNTSTGIGSGNYKITVNRANGTFLLSDTGEWELSKIKTY
jgi:hypothetical protein